MGCGGGDYWARTNDLLRVKQGDAVSLQGLHPAGPLWLNGRETPDPLLQYDLCGTLLRFTAKHPVLGNIYR